MFARDYATDVASVGEAQAQALEQARQMLEQTEKPDRPSGAPESHDKEMERAELMLADAKKSPDKLGAAVSRREVGLSGAS